MQGNQCEPTAHTLSCAGADRLAIRSIQLRVGELGEMHLQLFVDPVSYTHLTLPTIYSV